MSSSYLLYTSENPVFASFSFYAALLTFKVLAMSILTGYQRRINKAYANPEDGSSVGGKVKIDEDVERVRRAHLNDLENILPFLILGFIYVGIGPEAAWAKLLFRIFTVARFVHSFVYAVVVISQPARALAFLVGMAVNLIMVYSIMTKFI